MREKEELTIRNVLPKRNEMDLVIAPQNCAVGRSEYGRVISPVLVMSQHACHNRRVSRGSKRMQQRNYRWTITEQRGLRLWPHDYSGRRRIVRAVRLCQL